MIVPGFTEHCIDVSMVIKKLFPIVLCIAMLTVAILFANSFIAPLMFHSRIERLGETNLPSVRIESGGIIYCRMKADDFSFPLPPASHATNLTVTGSFNTVDGSLEARFNGPDQLTADEYQESLIGRLSPGGYITADHIPGGLLIKFHYMGGK